jgi:FAD:protein FMN transferase
MIMTSTEHRETFRCFGSECTVIVAAGTHERDAAASAALAKHRLLEWHERFSRFEPDSELTRLNEDPRPIVPVSPLMRRIIEAGVNAARSTGGLVDPTLVSEIERAGYRTRLPDPGLPLALALALAPPRAAAGPHPAAAWQSVGVDRRTGSVTRPPGTRFDSGGIAKGVFADELATLLARHEAFVVDCAGDMRLGGTAAVQRHVHVASPIDDRTLHTFDLASGAVATSGVGKRSWLGPDGLPAHHLLDPRSGRPAFTGIIQVTAFAPTATEAEVLSKAALLSGPQRAERVLLHGGLVVLDDGSWQVLGAAPPRPLFGRSALAQAATATTRFASQAHMSSRTRACSGSFRIS